MRISYFFTRLSLIVAICWHSTTIAAAWTVDPGIEIKGIYTDNVYLSPQGSEESEFITAVAPLLDVQGQGKDTDFSLNYRLERFFYSDNPKLSNTFHQMQTAIHRKLIDDVFFLDIDGTLTQQIIDPQQQISSSNAFVTDNQTNALGFSISPYVNSRNSNGTQILLKPTVSRYKYDEVPTLDNRRYKYELLYEQSRPQNNHGWLIRSDYTKVDYDNGDLSELRSVGLEGRVRVYRRVNLIAGIGYEDNEYDQVMGGGDIDGSNWNVGILWRPSRRMSVNANVGERYFGSTGSFGLTRNSRHSQWGLLYQETVEAGGQVAELVIPGPSIQQIADAEVSIIETTSANYTYNKAGSNIVFNISKTNRELQLSATSQETLSTQLSYVYTWSVRTSSEFIYTSTKNKYLPLDREDEDSIISISFNRKLGRTIGVAFLIQKNERNSDLISDTYAGNLASITFTAEF